MGNDLKPIDDSLAYTALGRYRLVRRIGRGGMGEVWLAEDPRLQRQVAIKVLPLRKRDDQEFLARFEREARAAASLHHPHILTVHDYGQQQMPDDQAVTYLVMPYVSGGSLEDRLKRAASGQGALTQDEALTYLSQVAEAIDYAHGHGIIHRDIKPANMLLREDNWLLLTDFGIARILTDGDSPTQTGASLGTPTYMAPEQAQGRAVASSDLYSLAIVTYQFFTGRVPFQAENSYALIFQHTFATPTSPRVYNSALSPQFEEALLRGMAKDPAQRPHSASAFVSSLVQALEPSRSPSTGYFTAAQLSTRVERTRPGKRLSRRNVLFGVGAGLLVAGGGTAAYLLGARPHPEAAGPKPRGSATPSGSPSASSAFSPLAITAAFTKAVAQMAWSPTKNMLLTLSVTNTNQGQGTLWKMPASGQAGAPTQFTQHTFASSVTGLLASWSSDGTKLALANAAYDLARGGHNTLIYAGDLSAPLPGLPGTPIFAKSGFQGLAWLAKNSLATLEESSDARGSLLKTWQIQLSQQQPVAVTIKQTPVADFSNSSNLLAISPQDGAMAVGTSDGMQVGQVVITGGRAVWQPLSPLLSVQGDLSVVGWSADGHLVAAANRAGGMVGIWDATRAYAPLRPTLDLSLFASGPASFAWGPVTQPYLLAIAGADGQVALWDAGRQAAPQRVLLGSIKATVVSLAWSADGHWLAASYDDAGATILIWRL